MTISIPTALFGSTADSNFENSESDTLSGDCDPTWNGSNSTHEWTKPLGTCGQTVSRSNEKIKIEKIFRLHESATVRRSASPIYTSPTIDFSLISVTFSCLFESSATASTSSMTINPNYIGVSATSTDGSADGSWEGSVVLSSYQSADFVTKLGQNETKVVVGSPIFVRAAWSVGTLGNVIRFYLSECIVEDLNQSQYKAKIIDQSCYAQAAGCMPIGPAGTVDAGGKIVATNADFQYSAFTFEEAASAPGLQRLTCSVSFCIVSANGTDCDEEIVNADEQEDCPTTAGYGFSPRGIMDIE